MLWDTSIRGIITCTDPRKIPMKLLSYISTSYDYLHDASSHYTSLTLMMPYWKDAAAGPSLGTILAVISTLVIAFLFGALTPHRLLYRLFLCDTYTITQVEYFMYISFTCMCFTRLDKSTPRRQKFMFTK